MRLPHHFTGQFGNPMDAAQESGTWGDEGKAVERRGALTALLFEQRSSAVNFDLDQRARVRSFVWIMHCALLANGRSWSFRAGQT